MTTDTVGGVWTYCLELAKTLGEEGVETVLATMGRPVSEQHAAEALRVPGLTLYQSSYKLEWMPSPWPEVDQAGEWLIELDRELEPDVVHLNNFAHASLPWSAPVVVVAHSCVLSWWRAVHGENAPPEWDEYASRVGRGLRAATHVVAPTRAMMSCVQEHYGPLLSKSVIPNCRRADLFQASRKEPIIFSAGRLWDQAKNVGLLDKIAPDLPWPVYLAGDGFGAQHANTLGQLSPVETGGWLSRASIYAMPARYEPFGLSVLEAALSGCALVLSDIESLRENWQDAALCIPPDDEEQWRSVLCDLANLPEHRQELASRARRRAIEFSPSRTARLYLGLYEDLIRQQEATRKRAMVI